MRGGWGIDLIVIHSSGHYRMAGRASLAAMTAYANAIAKEMACEILPVVPHTPVLAGVEDGATALASFRLLG
jgi:predicted TIM-barrel enzyme